MNKKVFLHPFLALALGSNTVFSDTTPAPTVAPPPAAVNVSPHIDSTVFALTKIDSLRNKLEQTIYPVKLQEDWNLCSENKRELVLKAHQTDKNMRQLDSLLHASKAAGTPPTDPKVKLLMARKLGLQEKMENRYRLTPEGKKCAVVDEKRKHLLDSALAANPDYPNLKRLAAPQPSK